MAVPQSDWHPILEARQNGTVVEVRITGKFDQILTLMPGDRLDFSYEATQDGTVVQAVPTEEEVEEVARRLTALATRLGRPPVNKYRDALVECLDDLALFGMQKPAFELLVGRTEVP